MPWCETKHAAYTLSNYRHEELIEKNGIYAEMWRQQLEAADSNGDSGSKDGDGDSEVGATGGDSIAPVKA